MAESRTFEPVLSYDPEQSIDALIPSMAADFLPAGHIPGSEGGSTEFLTGPIDSTKQGCSGGQTRNRDVFADGASHPIDVDNGMDLVWSYTGLG